MPETPPRSVARDLAACTIVAKPRFADARVLAASFRRRHPDVPFIVLLADRDDGRIDPAREPFELLALDELGIPDDAAFRFRYAQQALTYATTPFLVRHLLDRGLRRVVFLKQESLVVGDLSATFERLARRPILLTPHLTAPLAGAGAVERELSVLLAGAYNVGFLGVSESAESRRFLDWWADRVAADARHDVAAGFHYEQRWLDLVPSYFPGAEILRAPGDNVGHWNLPERRIELRGDEVLADGEPCRLIRFSGYDPERPERATVHSDRLETARLGDAGRLFARYRRLLLEAGYHETRTWPYAWDAFDDGAPIPAIARDIYAALGAAAERFGDPFATAGAGSFRAWLEAPAGTAPATTGTVSRYWHGVWARREDLRRAFADPLGADREAFLAWASSSGAREHPGSDRFLRERLP